MPASTRLNLLLVGGGLVLGAGLFLRRARRAV
jgi:hypothetical protein